MSAPYGVSGYMYDRDDSRSPVATPTAPNTPAGYSDEVVERCVALVRRMTEPGWDASNVDWVAPILTEARAIVALLPEPVDARELQLAKEIAQRRDLLPVNQEAVQDKVIETLVEAIQAGRALAAGGR